MGERRIVDKTIGPAEIVRALAAGNITIAQAQQMFNGVMPIGDYKGVAAILDLDKLVIQPLIQAEKQWTEDIVDTRNGYVTITVPIGTKQGSSVSGSIEVPEGEVWYLCEHEIMIHQAAGLIAGDIGVNFLVSSFPKVDVADKPYYDVNNPKAYLTTGGSKVSGGGLVATQAEIAAGDIYDHKLITTHGWKTVTTDTTVTSEAADWVQEVQRDFREGDELNTELRLVGGDKLTLVATVYTADVAGDAVVVDLRVFGRVGKLLVS